MREEAEAEGKKARGGCGGELKEERGEVVGGGALRAMRLPRHVIW